MGTPAMSLPLAMHSTGVPIGVQIAAKPAAEHLLLQLATALEEAMPWKGRVPAARVQDVRGPSSFLTEAIALSRRCGVPHGPSSDPRRI